jgi:ABC-2 type transport system ATP-binding protein
LVCDRVLIINQGKIVANDSIDRLQSRLEDNQLVQVELAETIDAKQWQALSGLEALRQLTEKTWEISSVSTSDIRPDLFNFVVNQGWTLLEMKQLEKSVEEVFQQLTRS